MSVIATELTISPSEVHGALQRLQFTHLVHGSELRNRPNVAALEEFLLHGVKYAFPAERGSVMRGIPTSYAAPPLSGEIAPGDGLPPVWPWRDGHVRGIALTPLYKTAPSAALRDQRLYELLSLVDALRDGRARERKIAERELVTRIRSLRGSPQS
jgi:hypothetical protein